MLAINVRIEFSWTFETCWYFETFDVRVWIFHKISLEKFIFFPKVDVPIWLHWTVMSIFKEKTTNTLTTKYIIYLLWIKAKYLIYNPSHFWHILLITDVQQSPPSSPRLLLNMNNQMSYAISTECISWSLFRSTYWCFWH